MHDAAFAPAPHALDTAPLREPSAFDALVREIGEDGASEVRAVFWSDTSTRLSLLRTLAPHQHRSRIAREAHSLKSTARTFGYVRLATLALRLESRADALDDAEYCDLLERMNSAFAAAKALDPRD